MFMWHCTLNVLKVVLVLCCTNQTWGHQYDAYRNNLTNSPPSQPLNVHSTSERGASGNRHEDSDKIKSNVSTLAPGIQLSDGRGRLRNTMTSNDTDTSTTTSPPITTSTVLSSKITISDQQDTPTTGLPSIPLPTTSEEISTTNTRNEREFGASHEAHTMDTNINNSTDDKPYHNMGNNSLPVKPVYPSRPSRPSDEASEHRLQTTPAPHDIEHRGHPHEHEGVGDDVGEAGRKTNLCATCLCDSQELNVYCKHEHLYNGESHRLRLTRALLPPAAVTLHIQGFERLIIVPGTFSAHNLTLRQIHFENIEKVELQNGSLRFSSMAPENMEVQLHFTNCQIPELPTTTLSQYARSNDQRNDINLERTRFLSLYIKRCNITTIRTNALYQARLLYFTMSHTTVGAVERQGIHIDIYEDWKVEYCVLPNLVSKAICLRTQRVVIFSRNTMSGLANRSLDILSSNQVLFEYNYVTHLGSGALLGIRPYEGERGANIVFLNNTVTNADNGSLTISSQYPIHERKILDNRFHVLCTCQIKDVFRGLLGGGDHIGEATLASLLMKSKCKRFPGGVSYSRVGAYLEEACTNMPIPIIVSTTVVAIAVLITVIVSIIFVKRAQKAREEANYLGECSYSHSFSTLHSNHGPLSPTSISHSWDRSGNAQQPWVMAVPEVKTYQETELHMAYEHTEPINGSVRGSFPPDLGPFMDLQRKTQMRASCPFN